MANRIRTGDPRGFNKGRSSKFREGSRVRQTPEEGRRTYRPKRYGNNNKDKDNSPKTLNDKNISRLRTYCCIAIFSRRVVVLSRWMGRYQKNVSPNNILLVLNSVFPSPSLVVSQSAQPFTNSWGRREANVLSQGH